MGWGGGAGGPRRLLGSHSCGSSFQQQQQQLQGGGAALQPLQLHSSQRYSHGRVSSGTGATAEAEPPGGADSAPMLQLQLQALAQYM